MTEQAAAYLDSPAEQTFHVLREATGHDGRISIERIYIEAMDGDLIGGLFVSQLIFWSKHTKHPEGWFYRSADEWREKDYLTRYQVDKYTDTCIQAGWLETKVMKVKGAPTRHYKVKGAAFVNWLNQQIGTPILSNPANGSAETNESIELPVSTNVYEQTPITDTDLQTPREVPAPQAPRPLSPHQELFGAVCEAVGYDYHTLTKEDQGQVAQACGILAKAGYDASHVRRFITEIWFKDWRWKNNESLPSLKQLRQEIGRIHSPVPSMAPLSTGNRAVDAVGAYIARRKGAAA